MEFAFYSSFCKCAKRGSNIRKKTKELSQFLKSHMSGTLEVISLKFGMWSAEVGGRVHSKNRLVSLRQHGNAKIAFLFFLSISKSNPKQPSCKKSVQPSKRLC